MLALGVDTLKSKQQELWVEGGMSNINMGRR